MAKQKGNVYDVTVKDLFGNGREVLVNYFGSIKVEQAEDLKIEFSRFQSKRSDLVMKGQMEGHTIAMHIEFQSSNDRNMRYRMLRYAAEIGEQYALPVYQMVIYLGRKEPDMVDEIAYDFGTTNRLDYRYKVVDIGGIAYEELKASNNPLLYSLLPLTDRQRRKTEEAKFLKRCIKDIIDAPFKMEEKRETVARAEVFAGLVFSEDIIGRIFEGVERMLNLEESAGYATWPRV